MLIFYRDTEYKIGLWSGIVLPQIFYALSKSLFEEILYLAILACNNNFGISW